MIKLLLTNKLINHLPVILYGNEIVTQLGGIFVFKIQIIFMY